MIVNRLWPGGMAVAIRSITAWSMAAESSFCSDDVLTRSEASTGQ